MLQSFSFYFILQFFQQTKQRLIMSLGLGYANQQTQPTAESKKLFCAYHKTQFLTNFCLEKQCLMPLCPSCVAEHTEQHYQASHKPTYINLNEALHEVKQRCYANIVSLQEYSRKNEQLVRYRENLEQNVHDQLSQCKQEIYIKIQQMFQKYETKIIKQIQERYHNSSIYEQQQSDTIKQYIQEQTEVLYEKIALLKSDQCLAALIRFYDHEEEQYDQGLKDVNEYLEKHKKAGYAYVRLNTESLNQKLQNLCESILNLTFGSNQEKQDSKQNIRGSKVRKNQSLNVNNPSLTPTQKQKSSRPLAASNKKIVTPIGDYQSKAKNAY